MNSQYKDAMKFMDKWYQGELNMDEWGYDVDEVWSNYHWYINHPQAESHEQEYRECIK